MNSKRQIVIDVEARTVSCGGGVWHANRSDAERGINALARLLDNGLARGRRKSARGKSLTRFTIDLDAGQVRPSVTDESVLALIFEILDEHLAGTHGLRNFPGATAGARRLSTRAERLAKQAAWKLPEPRSAWLLMGDSASIPTDDALTDYALSAASDDDGFRWTCSPHVEVGDLLFFYFVKPHSAILFIGTACCSAFYDPEEGVNANTKVDPHQWWTHVGPMVAIEPIAIGRLRRAVNQSLILKGRSGKYLAPESANRLLSIAKIRCDPIGWASDVALTPVTGRNELPASEDIRLRDLRDLPSSLLRLEAEVERYVVDPLVRLTRIQTKFRQVVRQFRLGRRAADYAVLRSDRLVCIIEVKLRFHLSPDQDWASCPDVAQARDYASAGACSFVLIDCETIACFSAGAQRPDHVFDRHELTKAHLSVMARYFRGDSD